ncbi:MAG: gamma-glutamylcyclotransferase [Chromatiaceae bacterium]|nr:MAG: gamma-glutamylcyclotransferase [Chromatiaceae bacterium]
MVVSTRVFVYGTLLKGLCRHGALRKARFLGRAHTHGQLFDLGSYPGLKAGPGTVHGEVYEVDALTLSRLDRIEDYDPNRPTNSLYLRVHREATLQGGRRLQVQTYLYNRPARPTDLIAHGDYRAHCLPAGDADKVR